MTPIEPGREARVLLTSARALDDHAHRALVAERNARTAVERAFAGLRDQMVQREIAAIPIARLKDTTAGRLRLGVLEQHGYRTIADVIAAGPGRLQQVPGVGPQTAYQAFAAARQVASAAAESINVRIDLDPANPVSTGLVAATARFDEVEKALAPFRETTLRISNELEALLVAAAPARGRIRWLFTGGERKHAAREALQRLQQWTDYAETSGVTVQLDRVDSVAATPFPPSDRVWKDFERRSAEYYGILGEIVDLKLDVAAAEGFLPAEIVAKVHEQSLDDQHRTVTLRGYQSFGARFALVQRRVIIGDEMGLGKTIQAIAAIAHLKSLGQTHFVVVCPASVLINWTREIRARSRLAAYRVHGATRDQELRSWLRRGDVAVTTFETLRSISMPGYTSIAMLVVDEAHYIKNPAAIRTRHTNALAARADRVLFLTGTPMENRVEEFRALVHHLQPAVANRLETRHAIVGPDAFRKAVAPVYLRRNQEDVLTELPDLVQVDEWEEFSRSDFVAYREAVMRGNFMAMRQAAFASGDPRESAKLKRLLELADEAGDNGHKVVVFSYFRSVLDTAFRALGPRAVGPLTGSVPPAQRQGLVDAFSSADGHSVLVSQIQAGGVGLNMQAASVAILCEPQVKPTTEAQAVARLHRMGQVRKVQVHRLLTVDSVDQRMLELLDSKRRLFDDYARISSTAAASPEAIDISEAELARTVVEDEQERLALSLISPMDAGAEPA